MPGARDEVVVGLQRHPVEPAVLASSRPSTRSPGRPGRRHDTPPPPTTRTFSRRQVFWDGFSPRSRPKRMAVLLAVVWLAVWLKLRVLQWMWTEMMTGRQRK